MKQTFNITCSLSCNWYFSCSFEFCCYQGPEVRSGDLPQPIMLTPGQEFTFTIRRGVGTADCVSVNYDDFVNDVEVGDMLLVDGMRLFYHQGKLSFLPRALGLDFPKCILFWW